MLEKSTFRAMTISVICGSLEECQKGVLADLFSTKQIYFGQINAAQTPTQTTAI